MAAGNSGRTQLRSVDLRASVPETQPILEHRDIGRNDFSRPGFHHAMYRGGAQS